MKYFQSKTALSTKIMEDIVEEAAEEETEAAQIQSVLDGVAGYVITDLLENIAELADKGILESVRDVCEYLYNLY